uniref:Thioredoxin domain containing 16 n=1 Tax=Pseudonaja textilis TaxID=8673 RepID=A0A670XV76_PSETE
MSSPQMTQRTHFFFLLIWISCISVTSGVKNVIPELSPQEYFSSLQASKASLVYFQKDVSPSSEVFLEQLENSREALQDYGISILKVIVFIAEVLHLLVIPFLPSALLFNEVKYISTLMNLQHLENSLKRQSDLAFAYVQAIGTAEHRVFMEAAFVYGSIKFALTTEVAVLKSIRYPEVPSSKLFFCHCKVAMDPELPCRRTLMEEPLTTLSIHKFLKLMGEPLVVEVAEDPEKISTTHLQLGLPLIFILSQEETLEADKRIAESVAWQLLGKAGVFLLSRFSGIKIKKELKSIREGRTYLTTVLSVNLEIYEEEEDEGDDEVVESVVRDRKRELHQEHIRTLTEESFLSILAGTNHTAVLFYASWEAVSLVVMQSFLEVAAQLKGTPEISLARVNCWDWPHLCLQENVTQFPIMKMYTKERAWLAYSGMWETKEMMKFIELKEIWSLSREAFIEAGRILNGYVTTGIYYEEDATILYVAFFHNSWSIFPLLYVSFALLQPEITVENLPDYFQMKKPLLILFSDGDPGEREIEEIKHVAIGEDHKTFIACWLNLKNTPVGRSILKAYFGNSVPPVPLLLWINFHSGGHVFVFPSDQSISETSILAWIEKLKTKQEAPRGK